MEVGVGTGRVAEALRLDVGVDPALTALERARSRGVRAVGALGEALPFADQTYGLVVMSATLCFAPEPVALLREVARVVRDGGRVVVGVVPRGSSWGRRYEEWGRAGHPFYSLARLSTVDEVRALLEGVGLVIDRVRATLWGGYDQVDAAALAVTTPIAETADDAGFVALGAVRTPTSQDWDFRP